MATLEASGVEKHFGGVQALRGANLTCEAGRITGLLGANGSGKSTMCKIIVGTHQYDKGEISYEGHAVRFKSAGEARKNGVVMAFQNLSLSPNLSVWENISLGHEKSKKLFTDDEWAKKIAREWIDKLSPGIDIEQEVADLRPGDMQIVEIAKAMSVEKKVLLLDEPTAALEQFQVKNLFTVMRQLASEGVSIVFISHRLPEVIEICDDIVVFRNGENVGLLNLKKEDDVHNKLISLITGGKSLEVINRKAQRVQRSVEGIPALSVKHLATEDLLLQDISFTLKKGEIIGVGGLAGQGQDELMLALAGYRRTTGTVKLDGNEIELRSPKQVIRLGMVLVPGDKQTQGLFMNHSLRENVAFTKYALKKQPVWNPIAQYERECEELIEYLSIEAPSPKVVVQYLSGGNQQKVVLGKWLNHEPKVLLLADPAKGVDVGSRQEIYKKIQQMVTEKGMSVVLFASDHEELVSNCDRVLVMYEGSIVSTIEGEKISEDSIMEASLLIHDTEGAYHD